ncbi:hypothetical protein Tco_0579471 [Tanacetum coccineum]
MEHTFKEPSPAHQHFSPLQEHAQGQMTLDDLLQVVPQLMTRVDSLEKDLKQTKLTMGSAIVKLVKKVKKLEGFGYFFKTSGHASGERIKLKTYKRRKKTKGKKVVTSLDFQEEVSTVSRKVSTVSGQVSTDSIKKSIPSPDKGQREGKTPMIIEEAPKKTKEQIL